jgi:hypothetical protein
VRFFLGWKVEDGRFFGVEGGGLGVFFKKRPLLRMLEVAAFFLKH